MTPAQREQRLANVRSIAEARRAADTCVRGHKFTPANTYTRPDNGRRQCLTCQSDRSWYCKRGLGMAA